MQGILEAAQTTAAEIEREAQRDAQHTREQAAGELERARAHVETLARAAAALLAQVQSLDGEVGALAQSLRAEGASQEGASPEDASQAAPAPEKEREVLLPASVPAAEELREAVPPDPASVEAGADAHDHLPPAPLSPDERSRDFASPVPSAVPPAGVGQQRAEDLDGARLVALNMALSGEPREQTDRYLADSFQLSDRAKLLDEVYAAIEG